MTPELKIDANLDIIMSSCPSRHATERITLHVSISALSSSSLSQFIQRMAEWSQRKESSGESEVKVDTSGLEQEASRMMTVSTTCGDLSSVVDDLTNQPEVLWVEERLPIVTHNRWLKGVCQSGSYASTPLYSANLTGYGQLIGIVDTGMDMFSCQLHDPNVDPPFDVVNFKHRKVVTYKTSFGDRVDDAEAHGTHVGSTAAGQPYANYGDYKKYSGIAYNAKIAFIDIGNTATGVLSIPPDLYNQAFRPLYEVGVRIFTNSWGSTGAAANKYTAESQTVDKFMVDYPEALVFYAGGNEGDLGWHTVGSPSTNKNGICAGASLNDWQSWQAYSGANVDEMYGAQSMGNFSSKGPTADGRRKPDLVGPGWWVTSASGYPSSTEPQCEVKGMRGTSMATPVLAAHALLVREYFMKGFYPRGVATAGQGFTPSGALLKAVLLHSGQPIDQVIDDKAKVYSTFGYPSSVQGYGRIQLDQVLYVNIEDSSSVNLYVVGAASSSHPYYAALAVSGNFHSYVLSASDSTAALRVTLAYTDQSGGVGSSTILVNDLDLTLIGGGKTYYPIPDNANSKLENVEQIILNNPTPYANYTIKVTARYTSGTQPYALVITGHKEAHNTSDMSPDTSHQRMFFLKLAEISPTVRRVIIVQAFFFVSLLVIVVSVAFSNSVSSANKSNPDNI
eukprot:CAMPEP_0182418256 /NCGR_PEP_ID=MMETSP1167-20130531/2742_1 /TAXON_ID=2988 /ORGANISM="Mallomonas Sp, Strain CCMP3275" /LENGTH=676 /DNA_ID=CAMNT_0024592391 /DNA_START=428 /DNA_END=2458 /DNA_ORIENTATION=-